MLFLTVPFAPPSFAQSEGLLNKLLAPGPLISAHKDLEGSDCLKCHDAGKGVPNAKCMECHKEISAKVNKKSGYHGLMVDSCINCHHDHKGRDFDSVGVNKETFDHKKTGFLLEGKHAKINCNECHREKRTKRTVRPKDLVYVGKTTTCTSCHKKDDPHYFKGQLAKKDCNACHGLRTWKDDVKFDHDTETHFALEGAHQDLQCAKCHILEKQNKTIKYQWNDLKTQKCMTCHADIHKTNLSPRFRMGDCQKCHNQEHWKIEKFDHALTHFPLHGKHADLTCTKCHIQNAKAVKAGTKSYRWVGLTAKCVSCHKDYHVFGSLKPKAIGNLSTCLVCHNETKWNEIKNFDHSKQTRYLIDGRHNEVKCEECHIIGARKVAGVIPDVVPPRRGIYHWAKLNEKTCENCHKSPHIGVFSAAMSAKACTDCHITQDWKLDKNRAGFKHDETRFALTGEHARITCNACHLINQKQVFKFPSFERKFCLDCHKNQHADQFHEKLANQSCAECHSTKKWEPQNDFNHDTTNFKLRDAHAQLNCSDCHLPTARRFENKKASFKHQFLFPELNKKNCVTCHADYHAGQLATNCSHCHSEKNWKTTKFNHDIDSQFPLKDKHKQIKCSSCHKAIRNEFVMFAKAERPLIKYKTISSQCLNCHRDPHAGTLGLRCNECHSERGWHVTKDFHRNFVLHGVHYTLGCAECHIDNRKLSGLSEQCLICHQKDDVHSGSLPNCSECHRQTFWEHTSFRHSMTFFPLRGVHRTLTCATCHANGIYRGTPNQCVNCHLSDAQGVGSPVHIMPNFTECKSCHNQFSFGH
jgi:hypothetical protein